MDNKRRYLIILILCLLFAGCGKQVPAAEDPFDPYSVELPGLTDREIPKLTEAAETASESKPISVETTAPEETASEPPVDLDLTQMSATAAYSQIFILCMEPKEYIGKTCRMRGQFFTMVDLDENMEISQYHMGCVLTDGPGCCSSGVEFVLAGEHKFPDDYPEQGTEITVTGVFGLYDDQFGNQVIYLSNAEMSL